jgi:hypothetical protein
MMPFISSAKQTKLAEANRSQDGAICGPCSDPSLDSGDLDAFKFVRCLRLYTYDMHCSAVLQF